VSAETIILAKDVTNVKFAKKAGALTLALSNANATLITTMAVVLLDITAMQPIVAPNAFPNVRLTLLSSSVPFVHVRCLLLQDATLLMPFASMITVEDAIATTSTPRVKKSAKNVNSRIAEKLHPIEQSTVAEDQSKPLLEDVFEMTREDVNGNDKNVLLPLVNLKHARNIVLMDSRREMMVAKFANAKKSLVAKASSVLPLIV